MIYSKKYKAEPLFQDQQPTADPFDYMLSNILDGEKDATHLRATSLLLIASPAPLATSLGVVVPYLGTSRIQVLLSTLLWYISVKIS